MPQFIRGCHDCGEWPVSDDHRCPATAGPIPNWVQQLADKDNELEELKQQNRDLKSENDRLIRAKREVHEKLVAVQRELSDLRKERSLVENG